MLRNYLVTAFRYLWKNKFLSVSNVICLIIGFSSFLIIMNYIIYQRSFDKFHENSKNIYKINLNIYSGEQIVDKWSPVPCPLAPALKEAFPEIIEYVRFVCPGVNRGLNVVMYKDKKFIEEKINITFVDPSIFKVFSFKLIRGNPESALQDPYSVVLTQSYAKKYFGNEDPMNKFLIFVNKKNRYTCKVSGIIEDTPENSHLEMYILVSLEAYFSVYKRPKNDWGLHECKSYILTASNTNPKILEAKFTAFLEKINPGDKNRPRAFYKYILQPFEDIYLYSPPDLRWHTNMAKIGNRKTVFYLFLMALIVMAISWLNYTNLSATRASERAKEVGIRKVLGGYRTQLIIQFFIESLILNIIAVFFTMLLIINLLPMINQLTRINISLYLFNNFYTWLGIFGFLLIGILLSSWYPSFILSSFKPATVLSGKGNFGHSKHGILFQKVLVIVQFLSALIFIIGTIVIYTQINFMKNQDVGFDKDKILVAKEPIAFKDSVYYHNINTLITEIKSLATVDNICVSSHIPGTEDSWAGFFHLDNNKDERVPLSMTWAGYNFFDTYNIDLLTGRNFSKEFGTDDRAVILNEAAIKILGIQSPEDVFKHKLGTRNILGVAKNHHNQSLKDDFSPTVFFRIVPWKTNYYSFKINISDFRKIIPTIQEKWMSIFPDSPFEYFILSDYFDKQYIDDIVFSKIFGLLAFIAIMITCLGIFTVSYYDIIKRTKEIGIRKVLGASIGNILFVLSKDVLKLIIIANSLAWPIAYFIMNNWLRNYATRIKMPLWIFFVSGLLMTVIALITISYHTVTAAIKNPVKALRYE